MRLQGGNLCHRHCTLFSPIASTSKRMGKVGRRGCQHIQTDGMFWRGIYRYIQLDGMFEKRGCQRFQSDGMVGRSVCQYIQTDGMFGRIDCCMPFVMW